MSIWTLFRNPWAPESATSGGVTKTTKDSHDFDTVLSAISIVGILSRGLARTKDRKTKIYAILVNVETAAATLTGHLHNIKRTGKSVTHEANIRLLANCLEDIFSDAIFGLFDHRSDLAHPRLHAVMAFDSQEWCDSPEQYAPRLASLHGSDQILRQLKRFVDKFQSFETDTDDSQPDLDSEKTWPRGPDEDICKLIQGALDAVRCRCLCKSKRAVRLKLGTYRKRTHTPKPDSLCILLGLENSASGWHEIHIHNTDIDTKHQARAQAVEEYMDSCLCQHFKSEFLNQHVARDFVLKHEVLDVSQKIFERRLVEPTYQNEVNLKQLLTSHNKHWTMASKYTLSIILAYSLVYLLRDTDVEGHWRQENILFFTNEEETHVPLRPFFKAPGDPIACEIQVSRSSLFHKFPELLELGVMLLETLLGERLKPFLEERKRIRTTDELFFYAHAIYRNNESHINDITPGGYKNAIHACIYPSTFANYNGDGPNMRSEIFQSIVRPLEEDLLAIIELSSANDFVESAIKFDLDTSGFLGSSYDYSDLTEGEPLDKQREAGKTLAHYDNQYYLPHVMDRSKETSNPDGHRRTALQDRGVGSKLLELTNSTHTSEQKGRKTVKWVGGQPPPHDNDRVALFGKYKEHQPCDDCQDTLKWVRSFKILVTTHSNGRVREAPLRVAILDTGIDITHPLIQDEQSRIKESRTWCGGCGDQDNDGHGTYVAGILLDLTSTNVDIYVGKIMNAESCESRDNIAQALQYAREEWKVNMISLSFGYGFANDGKDLVGEEIQKCITQGILVFAAASNDGGRRNRTYPAKYSQVFCIHASNGVGNRWGFNPTPSEDPKKDNFSVVGQCLAWPPREYPGMGISKKHHSGTSFATPVAVSIAAFMIDFIEQNMAEYQWNIDPCTPEGMAMIFRELKVDRDGYEWVCPERYLATYSRDMVYLRLKELLGGYKA